TVYVPSSLITRVKFPTAPRPPASAPTGPNEPFHVPTRSLGRTDGRTSDSVDWATPQLFECVAQPESAINATVATNTIPRLPMLMSPPEAPSRALPEGGTRAQRGPNPRRVKNDQLRAMLRAAAGDDRSASRPEAVTEPADSGRGDR